MKKMFGKTLVQSLGVFWLMALLLACNSDKSQQDPETTGAHLGEIEFQVTGNADAIESFREGLLLLHSFEYADARKKFGDAREKDPSMAMAYWGEAMTHNSSLWATQNREEAVSVLNELSQSADERIELAASPIEKDFIQAVNILYGEGTKQERDQAYAEFMGQLYEKYPDNHEVAAFYSLSLLASVPAGRDVEIYERGAKVAQGILDENPRHPGALHYLIHSYDDPGHAHLALNAADNYSVVAPDATHALHMPSHIYVALGMWDEVIRSNIASYNSSVKRMEELELDVDARSYHAFHWLQYGYLQKKNFAEAKRILKEMVGYTDEVPSKGARAYLLNMKGGYLVETGDWSPEFTDIQVDVEDLNISQKGAAMYLDGYAHFHRKNLEGLQRSIHDLEREHSLAKEVAQDTKLSMCNAAGWTSSVPNQIDLDQTQVMIMQLKSLSAQLQSDDESAEEWMKKACDLEKDIDYMYGPPTIANPSFEMYGYWLIDKDRGAEALEQFEYALERGTKRMRALEGKKRAADLTGNSQLSQEVQRTIDDILDEKAT